MNTEHTQRDKSGEKLSELMRNLGQLTQEQIKCEVEQIVQTYRQDEYEYYVSYKARNMTCSVSNASTSR